MKRHGQDPALQAEIQQQIHLFQEAPMEGAAPLSALCAAAKSARERALINQAFSDRTPLYQALASDVAKTRKNAARLLGALESQSDTPALLQALQREETRFVRPSIILALGATGGQEARKALQALPLPALDAEDKHDREEGEALRMALSRLSPGSKHRFTGLSSPRTITLYAPAGFGTLLGQELEGLGIAVRNVWSDGVQVLTQDWKGLFRARCFTEALFPLGQATLPPPDGQGRYDAGITGTSAAAACRVPLFQLLQSCHDGPPPYSYRVECRLETDRGAFARAVAAKFDSAGQVLRNSPSQYEVELRVQPFNQGRLDVLCKLFTYQDQRFGYRRQAISASIQPATAAALCRYSQAFTPQRPLRVLDPCCGSGTLLIERGLLSPCACLTGLELVGDTVQKARENVAAAHSIAKILHKDCLTFQAREPFDLVLANLPFGNRVGSHDDNRRLYAGLLEKLPQWLAPGGVAILYTMEYALLQRCIKGQRAMAPISQARTAAGGLLPWVVALKKQ